MISILLVGVATALLICGIVLKVVANSPKKASKSEKAEIVKQILALSERENKISGSSSSIRSRPVSNPAPRPSDRPRKIETSISKPIRSL
jgi:hypothetical protein